MASPELKIERRRGTLTDHVAEALVRLIGRGEYPAGSRLPSELEMAKRFGVSRTVVREAVSRLKSEGLAESHQGKGVFVRAASADLSASTNLHWYTVFFVSALSLAAAHWLTQRFDKPMRAALMRRLRVPAQAQPG